MKKISIITGGSSGLGLSIGKLLAAKGDNVCLIARNPEKLTAAKEKLLENAKNDILTFAGNVSDEQFVSEVYAKLVDDGYTVTSLFNCAGVAKFGPPDITNNEMIDKVFQGSLIGTIIMSTYALKAMKEVGGMIINVMSSAAQKGNANESVYCAAKWGARGYTEALKASTKGSNIKVVGVYPGGMNTPFWKPDSGATVDVNKFMNPDEVAEQIVFSVSERNSMYVSDISIDRK